MQNKYRNSQTSIIRCLYNLLLVSGFPATLHVDPQDPSIPHRGHCFPYGGVVCLSPLLNTFQIPANKTVLLIQDIFFSFS